MRRSKKISPLLKILFRHLPPNLRGVLTRHFFNFKMRGFEEFEFKFVESFDEFLEAMSLVQQSYRDCGLTEEESSLRVSKYNLLPTTFTFIAKNKVTGEVVATMSGIHKTGLGLPIEDICSIDDYSNDGHRSCELASLAVKESYRSKSTGIFLILTIYVVKFLSENHGVKHFFISVRDRVRYFYEDIFTFKKIGKATLYSGVNNVVGIPMHFFLPKALEKLDDLFKGKPLTRNVYKLYHDFPWKEQCSFHSEKYNLISQFYLNDMKLSFLKEKNHELLSSMTLEDIQKIQDTYFRDDIFSIRMNGSLGRISREHARFWVYQNASLVDQNSKIPVEVLEVSYEGMMIRIQPNIVENKKILLEINLSPKEKIQVRVNIRWSKNNIYGVQICEKSNSKEWLSMIHYFETFLYDTNEKAA